MDGSRVLVVDDERFFREAISDVLNAQAIPVVLASTGEEALEKAVDESLGVVILDLQLPDLHGLEVFRHLRECRPDLRVIILSAHTDQEYVLEALRLGAFDYLAKPLHEEELSLAVGRARAAHGDAAALQRLRRRVERVEAALEELRRAGRDAGDGPLAAAVGDVAVRAAAELLEADRTSFLFLEEGQAVLRAVAVRGHELPAEKLDPVEPGEGVAGLVASQREPLLVPDVEVDDRFRGRAVEGRYRSSSFAAVPVVGETHLLGVLCATEPRSGRPLDVDDVLLLRVLAGATAAALQGAEVPASERDARVEGEPEDAASGRAAELARSICEALTAEVEPARVLSAALASVGRLLGAAPVSLYLLDAGSGELLREAEWDGGARSDRERLSPGLGLSGIAFETGQLVAVDVPDLDARFDASVDTPADGRAGPLLCGALRFRGRVLGVFRAFPEDPAAAAPGFGEVLAAALSAAIRNVLLYRSLLETIDEVAEARRGARSP